MADNVDVLIVGAGASGAADIDGAIYLAAIVDGQRQSVAAVLESEDYDRAVQAHRDNALVVLRGDLDRAGSGGDC